MKRWLIFVLVFLLFLNFSFVSAVTVSASDVKISVAGSSTTLQLAADGGNLKGLSSYASSSSISAGQHDASQIWVNVKGVEKTLLAALSLGVNGLCGSGSYSTYSSTSIPNPSHLATEIVFSSGTTLQAAINAGTFCAGCVPGTTKSCGTNTDCTTYTDVTCTTSGTWPTCSPTYVLWGRAWCGGSSWGLCDAGNCKTCNGAGGCEGYSGTGCGNCPFGTTTSGSYTYCINHVGSNWYSLYGPSAPYYSGQSHCIDSSAPYCHEHSCFTTCSDYDYSWILYPC